MHRGKCRKRVTLKKKKSLLLMLIENEPRRCNQVSMKPHGVQLSVEAALKTLKELLKRSCFMTCLLTTHTHTVISSKFGPAMIIKA